MPNSNLPLRFKKRRYQFSKKRGTCEQPACAPVVWQSLKASQTYYSRVA